MDPFKIDIAALKNRPGQRQEIIIEDILTPSADRSELKLKGPIKVTLTLENIGLEFLVQGEAEALIESNCARCLKDFDLALNVEFAQLFTDQPDLDNEDEMAIIADKIDIKPVVEEALLLDIPFSRICGQDCKGICPKCGQDLNENDCGCPKEEIDIRMVKLLELKDKLNFKDG